MTMWRAFLILERTSILFLANAFYHEAVAYRSNQEEVLHLHRLRSGEFRQLKMTTFANELGDAVPQFHVR